MTSKEFDNSVNISRKSVGSEFGFKKSGYVSYKIVNGYFFYLLHLVNASIDLYVKPFYADDLWCDIFQMPEAKKPISLRGNGAFALPGESIASYDTFPVTVKIIPNQLFGKFGNQYLMKLNRTYVILSLKILLRTCICLPLPMLAVIFLYLILLHYCIIIKYPR